jgi:hypothetical protein
MMLHRLAVGSIALLVLAGPVRAQDSGGFVVRLGSDTTSVERYVRTPARLEIWQVGRAPRVLQRHFVYDYAKGALTKASMVVTPVGSTTPTQTLELTWDSDSVRTRVRTGTAPVQTIAAALDQGTSVAALSSPWAAYEAVTMRLAKGKDDSLRVPLYFLGSTTANVLTVTKLGRDSVEIFNDRQDLFHARVDREGRIVGVLPISGTLKVSAERANDLDVDALAKSFAARESAGAGIGVLSPRDTVNATAGGAALWIDYSRPAKRGRSIFGNVVPYGEVWRTGANSATQFKTDKDLDFGGTVVPAGAYTLWTLPTATGWKLIVNSEVGISGTARKPEKDLYTIDMKVAPLSEGVERFTITVVPSAQGGALNLEWDTTRASAAFTVKP